MERITINQPNDLTPVWLRELLAREEVTDICINGTLEAYADCGMGMLPIPSPHLENSPLWSHEIELKNWVLHQLASVGKTWDARHPFIDATLNSPWGEHRLHVAFPPLARQGILVSLRRLARVSQSSFAAPSSKELADKRWGSSPHFDLLKRAVRNGESILISGATGGGKTTLANDLLAEIPHHERILALEDTPELSPAHPHFVTLVSRPPNADGFGEVTLRTLLKQALRMRPDRVILGECRGAEVLDLLQALNTGHKGTLATLHANSPRDALRRIELLCLLAAGGSIPVGTIRELLASGVQWIVQVGRSSPINDLPRREIRELWKIEGREGDTILLRPMV
jgi:pilus assembly protein CpaF